MTVTDPVCQMPIESAAALPVERDGETFFFCSEFCRRQFERRGAAYGRPGTAAVPLAWSSVRVAYFSMEVAFRSNAPTYAGGLGVLAGDHLQACADLGVAVVGVSLVHHMGYVKQRLRDGAQEDERSPGRLKRPSSDSQSRPPSRSKARTSTSAGGKRRSSGLESTSCHSSSSTRIIPRTMPGAAR